jgi:hypothetical protein
MSDHGNQAAARHSRREFLRISTGMAGAVSLGTMLTACETQSTQPVADSAAVEGGKQADTENAMRAARKVGAYVIIARYNLSKEMEVNVGGEHEPAREAAEQLFPYENPQGLQSLATFGTFHTFNSPFFDRLPDDFFDLPEEEQTRKAKSVIAELGGDNLGIGWMAVIGADAYESFVSKMGGKSGPLWRIFDIEEIALNDDRTTNDIYLLMTPRSWN